MGLVAILFVDPAKGIPALHRATQSGNSDAIAVAVLTRSKQIGVGRALMGFVGRLTYRMTFLNRVNRQSGSHTLLVDASLQLDLA